MQAWGRARTPISSTSAEGNRRSERRYRSCVASLAVERQAESRWFQPRSSLGLEPGGSPCRCLAKDRQFSCSREGASATLTSTGRTPTPQGSTADSPLLQADPLRPPRDAGYFTFSIFPGRWGALAQITSTAITSTASRNPTPSKAYTPAHTSPGLSYLRGSARRWYTVARDRPLLGVPQAVRNGLSMESTVPHPSSSHARDGGKGRSGAAVRVPVGTFVRP
jgi:hypothetical protein